MDGLNGSVGRFRDTHAGSADHSQEKFVLPPAHHFRRNVPLARFEQNSCGVPRPRMQPSSAISIRPKVLNASLKLWLFCSSDTGVVRASPNSASCRTSDFNPDRSVFDLYGIGCETDAGGRALGLPGAIVECRVVLRAFDLVVHDKSVCEMDLLMRAKTVRAKILVARTPIDGEGAVSVVKTDQIFGIDIVCATGTHPVGHHFIPLQ